MWTIHLLERSGHDLTGRKISSHSCKCTMLSYAAKFGMAWDDRLVLGGHVGHLKSPVTCSRDALARPLRLLSELLADVRIGRFAAGGSSLDASHGGSDVGLVEGGLAQPIVISDDEQVKSELPVGKDPLDFVDDLDTSSCDEIGNTSSSSETVRHKGWLDPHQLQRGTL